MKRFLLSCAAALGLAGVPSPAEAGSWVFGRSYYSHQPVDDVQVGRRPLSGPFYSRPQGAYVRSGYRNVRSTITVGGQSYDNAQFYESWVQFGEQF